MFPRFPERATQNAYLSAALRSIRRRRGLTVRQIAKAMNVGPRTYERFEAAARDEVRLDRIFDFASVTDSDPLALVAEMLLGSAQLSLHGAENKIMLIHAMALKRFNTEAGEDLASLDVATLIVAYSKLYEDLAEQLRVRREAARAWLEETSTDKLDADPKTAAPVKRSK
jgi:transcriptional regulator with XRE-family HTH domain